jgi:hypothetical protein
MKLIFTTLLACSALTSLAEDLGKSMLRVNITSQGWNAAVPWQKRPPNTRRGLGALLEGNRVLVTAELAQEVAYAELEQADTGRKVTAKVEFVDYEVNLAIMVATEDPGDFFAHNKPLSIDTTAKAKDKLDVWQFESNGTAVSTGIELNRIDIGDYFLAGERFLIFEANGAVQYRGGTFTLPVVKDGKLAGMLLSYSSKDQVSSVLPGVMIQRFLDDTKDGKYDGFPNFGMKSAVTLDPQLRSYLKLPDAEGGIFVSAVIPGSSAEKAGLKPNDVIRSINGMNIDSRGNYKHPEYGLLSMSHLIKGDATVGQTLDVTVWRDGKDEKVPVKLLRKEPHQHLVDPYLFDQGPKFTILGGLVFQQLTANYLRGDNDRNGGGPFRLQYASQNPEDFEKEGRKKIVFLSGILPAASNQGYDRLSGVIVDKVNGKFIADINDLAEALKTPENGIHKIELTDFPRVIYIDAEQAEKDNRETMPQRYRISLLQRL